MLGRAVSVSCTVFRDAEKHVCIHTRKKLSLKSKEKSDRMFLGLGGRRLQELNSVVCLTSKILLGGEGLFSHLVGNSSGADSHCLSRRQGPI